MPFVRMLVSWGAASLQVRDRFSNTLYFNVSGSVDDPDYDALCTDLAAIYQARTFTGGAKIEVRAYDMADPKPREEKGFATVTKTGNPPSTPGQLAVCLSYYADRNLPKRRGRIYTGPWSPADRFVTDAIRADLIAMGQALANLGGVNVDWSVYSPTSESLGQPNHWRISNIWVDNGWDVVRSRKYAGTARSTATIDG